MNNKFVTGQGVTYRPQGEAPGDFTVVCSMPHEDSAPEPKYRIKAPYEHFERVVRELDLTGSSAVRLVVAN